MIYYGGPRVLVGVNGGRAVFVEPRPGKEVAVWDLKKPLPPARGENTVAVSIHMVHCERITNNEGALLGQPADEIYFVSKEGNTQRRIGKEGDRDIVEFNAGTRKWLNDDLAQVVVADGKKNEVVVGVFEQEGKIRVKKLLLNFSGDGFKGASAEVDIGPGDDFVGAFLIELRNDKGVISASCMPGRRSSFQNGIVTCNGAGAKYNIHLVVDHYAKGRLQSIPLR